MKPVFRVLVTALVALAACVLSYWISLALIPLEADSRVASIVALLCAAVVGRYIWIALGSKAASGILPTTILWATVVGGIGFLVGFFGPLVFSPESNQGPLLGIFVTGPAGFLLGGVAGLVSARRQEGPPGAS